MSLNANHPLVSVNWLNDNLDNKDLIIFNATIPIVTTTISGNNKDKVQIKGAVFFDIKKVFSDADSPFPNTVLSPIKFQEEAQELGINKNSCIVVYDDLGVYSSPRVWWMFQLMGFTNIAVLNGGLPEWKLKGYHVEKTKDYVIKKGNFKVNYHSNKIKYTKEVLKNISTEEYLVADARSKGRFYGTEPEPRKDIKSGHIPNSCSLPYTKVLKNGKFKSSLELQGLFKKVNPKNKSLIFTCGSGITASILALAATIAGSKQYAVYDGSWTEWGSTKNLPITK